MSSITYTLMKRNASSSSTPCGLTDTEKYLFDLKGFIILRGVLAEEEIESAVGAIEKHKHEFVERHMDIKNAKQEAFAGESTNGRLVHGQFLQW